MKKGIYKYRIDTRRQKRELYKLESRHAPKDWAYFTVLRGFGCKYGASKVYTDFISIYDRTTNTIDSSVLSHIDTLSKDYGELSSP